MAANIHATVRALRKLGAKNSGGQDTVLAHITPEEAAKLKAEGGAGTVDPQTGLPHFYDPDAGRAGNYRTRERSEATDYGDERVSDEDTSVDPDIRGRLRAGDAAPTSDVRPSMRSFGSDSNLAERIANANDPSKTRTTTSVKVSDWGQVAKGGLGALGSLLTANLPGLAASGASIASGLTTETVKTNIDPSMQQNTRSPELAERDRKNRENASSMVATAKTDLTKQQDAAAAAEEQKKKDAAAASETKVDNSMQTTDLLGAYGRKKYGRRDQIIGGLSGLGGISVAKPKLGA
jgi:hypothetical protein